MSTYYEPGILHVFLVASNRDPTQLALIKRNFLVGITGKTMGYGLQAQLNSGVQMICSVFSLSLSHAVLPFSIFISWLLYVGFMLR